MGGALIPPWFVWVLYSFGQVVSQHDARYNGSCLGQEEWGEEKRLEREGPLKKRRRIERQEGGRDIEGKLVGLKLVGRND